MEFKIKPDGSYDIVTATFSLSGCYPALDHECIHILGVALTQQENATRITYTLFEERQVILTLATDQFGLHIDCHLHGFLQAPHWVHPLAGARLNQVHRLFRQGIGFSGPTGFVDLSNEPDHFCHESYLITALSGLDGSTITVASHTHCDFLQKTHVESRLHRRQFRNREIDRKEIILEAGFSTESIPLPGGELALPTLHLRWDRQPWDVLRQTAAEIAAKTKARVSQAPSYHWCSWYDRSSFLTHQELSEFLKGIDGLAEKPRAVQIDDGYMPSKGDWLLTNHRWPMGMPAVFAEIKAHGAVPGIWVAPFMVGSRSELARTHPDWLLKDLNGNVHADWKHYDGTNNDEETYVLDTSHPEALAYIAHVFRSFKEAGAGFFKTDFLEWGFKDSTRFKRHTPGKTSAQYFYDAMKAIRHAIGEESHWLACISYFAPCIGFVDSMRVSSDVGPNWTNHGGTGNDGVGGGIENMLMETHGTQYFNNVFWQNDPDVTFLRSYHMELKDHEIQALAYWNGILGGSINTSDRLDLLPPQRLALWNFIKPQDTRWTARLPNWAHPESIYVIVRSFSELGSWAVLFLNRTAKPALNHYKVTDLIGIHEAHFHEWGAQNSNYVGVQSELIEHIEGHSARLYYVSKDASPPPIGLTLGGATPSKPDPSSCAVQANVPINGDITGSLS